MRIEIVKGTKDIFSPEIERWQTAESILREVCCLFDYREIRTPILEHTELFARGIGEETDVVNKEMYTFSDKKGRSITMRPENTASVIRAYILANMDKMPYLQRLFYIGPMFRYEKPQAGRLRQFHQFGVELIGRVKPEDDAEVIELCNELLIKLKAGGITFEINSVGCLKCRPIYSKIITDILSNKCDILCPDCNKRISANPLRVFDCKVPACQEIVNSIPPIDGFLCEDCKNHQESLLKLLLEMEIKVSKNSKIVRGLDYYTQTVFEVKSTKLGAQDALLGGGRYSGLMKEFGGPDLSGFGFAMGIERLLSISEFETKRNIPLVYIAWNGNKSLRIANGIANRLRQKGLSIHIDYDDRSFKSHLGRANGIDADFALILGDDEIKTKSAGLKNLKTGKQTMCDFDDIDIKIMEEFKDGNS